MQRYKYYLIYASIITILTYRNFCVKNVNSFGRNLELSYICGDESSNNKKAEYLKQDIQL